MLPVLPFGYRMNIPGETVDLTDLFQVGKVLLKCRIPRSQEDSLPQYGGDLDLLFRFAQVKITAVGTVMRTS